jgi:hypothetical protein
MEHELLKGDDKARRLSYERFFESNEYLDCAQLFRSAVGEERYVEFLRSQFATQDEDAASLTPSHAALVRLPVRELFTTNYDELIELAYRESGGRDGGQLSW